MLLQLKLFPWSLLWLNPLFFGARALGVLIAARNGGGRDMSYFPGWAGKWTIARALLRGDLAALRLAPRMLHKRAEIRRIRKLSGREVRRLILAHRLSLREVA